MEKLLKKGHFGIISQFHAIQGMEDPTPELHAEIQRILENHQQVFTTTKGLPLSRGEHDNNIPLIIGSQPPIIRPYRYPFSQKNEIEKIIQELSKAGIIRPSTSPYYSLVVMVLKKEGD